MYETLVTLLLNAKKNDQAMAIIEKGLAKFPSSIKLKDAQGTAFYQSGNTDKFVTNLKEQLSKNSNDATNWYNLGVMQAKSPGMSADAETSFKKAIELKPDMSNAHQNLVYTIIGDDQKMVDEINALRKTNADEATKKIQERKNRFERALPYAEKWYKVDPNNIDAVTMLKEIYAVTKNHAKMTEMKAKQAELEAKGK